MKRLIPSGWAFFYADRPQITINTSVPSSWSEGEGRVNISQSKLRKRCLFLGSSEKASYAVPADHPSTSG
jgi:hypothetical protein